MRAFALIGLFGASLAVHGQTLDTCAQSFQRFNGAKEATLPLGNGTMSCAVLENLRAGLIPTAQERAQIQNAAVKIQRFKDAQTEAKAMLDKEARQTVPAAVKTGARSAAAVWAVFKALKACTTAEAPLACAKRVASANRSVGKALDTYYDEYETNQILKDSSQKLLALLTTKIDTAGLEAADAQAKADAFLAACVMVARDCIDAEIVKP